MDERSTIAAVATASGRGGVAVVRVSGPEAFAIASALTGRRVDAACAGRFFHAVLRRAGKILDDGLVLVFKSPASYTGEDVVEFQTHGGTVAPRRVLTACLACGARLARRGEFTQRAFLNGRLDISAAEAVIDLVDAKTDRAADDAVARLGGAAARADAALYATALDVSTSARTNCLPGTWARCRRRLQISVRGLHLRRRVSAKAGSCAMARSWCWRVRRTRGRARSSTPSSACGAQS